MSRLQDWALASWQVGWWETSPIIVG